ncbi:MAG TPA: POTRA domain-containing protein [Pyrinomonadaceae bacterium]|nr:POTRA domain-containing protein [Pyrinomonadaceae bacterium]
MRVLFAIVALSLLPFAARADVRLAPDLTRFEGRVVETVELEVEQASVPEAALGELRARLRLAAGEPFSAILARESLQALFDSGRVADARIEATDSTRLGPDGRARVRLRFVIRPQVVVDDVEFEVGVTEGTGITEEELRARLNLLEPGRRLTEQALRQNADAVQVYLRDRGFFRAEVSYEQRLDPSRTRATVVFRVEPGPATRLESFDVKIDGFGPADLAAVKLPMPPGGRFTQEGLGANVAAVRRAVMDKGFLAPRIDEPEVSFDPATNSIAVALKGSVGPKVTVNVTGHELSEKRQRELLPVLREGTIEFSAVVEGERRLRNRLQEEGYFFPEVTSTCVVVPPLAPAPQPAPLALPGGEAGEPSTCELINPDELAGRSVTINYEINRGRRFELTEIRIEGTDALSVADVEGQLRSQEANVFGIIPFLGYGRGYTSDDALERDRQLIRTRLRNELGYRQAEVDVRRGVALEGDDLIITFDVTEGPLTRVEGVDVRGNQIFTAEQLERARCPEDPLPDETCVIRGAPFSRVAARSDADRLRGHYVRNGYVEADVQLSVVNLPRAPGSKDDRVRLLYTVAESDKVFIRHIIVSGLVMTKPEAVLEAIPLRENEVLRGDDLAESERILLNTSDAFRQVIIRTEPAGETEGGFKRRDVFIDVEERERITTDYIVGFSTDNGPLGGFEVRNVNLFGQLRQGAFRSRFSRLQQLVRLEYFDPRFQRYGAREFAPLTASVQYQRDTSVTRFFRTTIDRGANGVVQRFDPEGNLIDEFGREVKGPSINRLSFNLETQRDLELELSPAGAVRRRSTIFLRYNYEDVRLFNIGSLLIAPMLRPDQAVRLSRLAASFARDTRDRQFDPTRGDFLTLDYSLALKQLGGNISFNKLLATYRRYRTFKLLRDTTLAAGFQLGLANILQPSDRDDDGLITDVDRRLPISERFFSGGSTSLRGFAFEEAGPRVVAPFCAFGPQPSPLPPCGTFRDEKGEPIELNPFTVPVGGNAVAVVNLEARVGVRRDLQVVPFYDGGNVFERVSDLFGRGDDEPGRDPNLRAKWTHTVGLGLRLKTPFGSLGVDYGYLLNPPEFLIPQFGGGTAVHRLRNSQIHFRFGQTF